MKQTTNYKFNKPELTDLPDITQLNQNFDTIDTELKAHDDEIKELGEALSGKADSSHSHTIGDLPLASIAEAKAGSIDTKVMTPAKAKESALAFGMAIKGTNPITSTADDTPVKWGQLGAGTYYFTQTGCLIDQPNQYGFLINHNNGSEVFQLFKKQNSGSMYYRSGNASGWGETWIKCANTADLGAYLPLAGGTMNGTIILNGSSATIKNKLDDSTTTIFGGTEWNKGAHLILSGNDEANLGRFSLVVANGDQYHSLKGKLDGTLTWGDKNIVCSVNGTNADASGNVAVTKDPNGKAFVTTDGATMNGEFVRNGNLAVNTLNNSYMQICGGKTSQNGGTVAVYGVEHSSMPGAVVLTDNGDTPAQLQLVNAGITHGGKNLVKSVNGTAADAAGNVALKAVITETWSSGTSWYRKWSDGWIEQGGVVPAVANANSTVTFPCKFTSVNWTLTLEERWHDTAQGGCLVQLSPSTDKTTTSATLQMRTIGGAAINFNYYGKTTKWRACGY